MSEALVFGIRTEFSRDHTATILEVETAALIGFMVLEVQKPHRAGPLNITSFASPNHDIALGCAAPKMPSPGHAVSPQRSP